ncbi:Phycoerythrin linker CpeS like protein [Geitlerinema sp. FC II]|nr:phycobiliprotein lyase [Geitlerinema sp. CS-897]PPT05510.1 Phycoerythrin linker CpeS like protein [Geitlerinema sp. FC II]
MNITKFFRLSLGRWRSQRTGHHLEQRHFEDVRSTVDVTLLDLDDPRVVRGCRDCGIDPDSATLPYQIDWYTDRTGRRGSDRLSRSLIVPVPNPDNANVGKLIQLALEPDAIVSIGDYQLSRDGTFTVTASQDSVTREERIWFATPNLRLHVCVIRLSDANVTTTTFTSDVRVLTPAQPKAATVSTAFDEMMR